MADFDTETAVVSAGVGRYTAEVSPRWSIGEVTNGGYLLALGLGAIRQAVGHPDPLTSTAHYLRPCGAGPAEIDVDIVRAGRTLSTAMARLHQGGRERVRILAAFGDLGAARGPTAMVGSAPTLPTPEACMAMAAGPRPGPSTPSLDIRSRVEVRVDPETAWWMQERPTTSYRAWVRLADGREPDTAVLPLLADAMPPAVFGAVASQWVPTVELTVHVRGRPAPGWLRANVSTRYLIDGAFEEDCELWDARGQLVAQSRQLARVLGASD